MPAHIMLKFQSVQWSSSWCLWNI